MQFATSRHYHVTSLTLLNVKQEEGEYLRTFIDMFSKVSLKINYLNLEVVLHYMITTLGPRPFVNDLCMTAYAGMSCENELLSLCGRRDDRIQKKYLD